MVPMIRRPAMSTLGPLALGPADGAASPCFSFLRVQVLVVRRRGRCGPCTGAVRMRSHLSLRSCRRPPPGGHLPRIRDAS